MRKTILLLTIAAVLLSPTAGPGQDPHRGRLRDVLPDNGLDKSSVVVLRDQASLNAHYYLADEAVLELDRQTDAAFARYRTDTRDALILAVAYPAVEDAKRVYGRFGHDFFSKKFDQGSPRFLEELETGDWAAVSRKGPFLIVVLEAPDRKACDALLRRIEEKVITLF